VTAFAERTALYRLYDEAGTLLYIGITKDLENRWSQHAKASLWWPRVAAKAIEWFPDRRSAMRVEKSEIQRLNPPCNSHWNTAEIKLRIQKERHLHHRAEMKARPMADPPEWHKTGLHDPD
jgi:predicted GIY-YIG superfamily endonuclease